MPKKKVKEDHDVKVQETEDPKEKETEVPKEDKRSRVIISTSNKSRSSKKLLSTSNLPSELPIYRQQKENKNG